jgi:hypothetical protein
MANMDEIVLVMPDGRRIVRLKLSDQERSNLISSWQSKRLDQAGIDLLRADLTRTCIKSGADPDEARCISASATHQTILALYDSLATYAINSRKARQIGGINSLGAAEAGEKPSREQVVRAIKRVRQSNVPDREIVSRVKQGGINLSTKRIRQIGQEECLLPKRGKGTR